MYNIINLRLDGRVWLAIFAGPHAANIIRNFGAATVPTAYSHHANPEFVRDEIAKHNPGVVVRFERKPVSLCKS